MSRSPATLADCKWSVAEVAAMLGRPVPGRDSPMRFDDVALEFVEDALRELMLPRGMVGPRMAAPWLRELLRLVMAAVRDDVLDEMAGVLIFDGDGRFCEVRRWPELGRTLVRPSAVISLSNIALRLHTALEAQP